MPSAMRELARDLGLADAGGAGEQEAADRLALVAQARARHLDRRGERLDGLVLAEDHQLEVALEVLQQVAVGGRDVLGRDARHARDDVLDLRAPRRAPRARPPACSRSRAPASSTTSIALSGRCRSLMCRSASSAAARSASSAYSTPWCSSNLRLQALQDLDRLGHRGLGHVDLLEAARQRVVLLEDAAVFLVGGRADAAELAVGEHRLDQVGGVHDAAGGGAGADHGVDLVDEQDRARAAS